MQAVQRNPFLWASQNQSVQKVYSVIFLFFYTTGVAGNTIIAVISGQHLNSHMYFFPCCLSFPRMTANFLVENTTNATVGCRAQLLMAYSCCTVSCRSSHCTALMTGSACGCVVISSWVGGLVRSSMQALITQLPFCGPNKADHYFCDGQPLLQLACAGTCTVSITVVVNSGVIAPHCLFILVVSYIATLASLRNQTPEEGHKTLSTYRSHITAVIPLFGPCTSTHPASSLLEDKVMALFDASITPMLN
ncbi:hypothetical protein CIB84_005927 [Bambusicola thoracicus]|uniref:G-protein coupled receptors family 1 profile domain-containing protein n=1 Tax=Bambusicola thoracicus TaxID=9083 RepID=A0A2P4T1T6_BAMTH|nr:hypothetical protein CIB84_005927 [Bambusicola thoracicus]